MCVNRPYDDCKLAQGAPAIIVRKPPHSFQGEAYFANDRFCAPAQYALAGLSFCEIR